ncbi:hypothetical protein [Arenivirga flava]|uniref:hypothetical protein n=1 Tax=Arenivirga flava TaxID=1930060 RepID=UPI0024E13F3D|nr:hypothetical protein [Arenivirga flava]
MRRAPVSGTRLLAILLATLVVAVGFTSFDGFMGKSGRAAAADLRTFDPGNIISDENFFNSATMDAPGVQRFLDSQVSSCPSGSLCLKNFRQDTFTRAGDRYCSEYAGAGRESAADIIAKVARACGINPQVILVTLQKEQGLVRASNPSRAAVDRAMGYMCPDTPQGCNPAYFGFYNQVFNAARQFKLYQFATNSNGSPYFTAYAPGGGATFASARPRPAVCPEFSSRTRRLRTSTTTPRTSRTPLPWRTSTATETPALHTGTGTSSATTPTGLEAPPSRSEGPLLAIGVHSAAQRAFSAARSEARSPIR